jgi:phage tail sheath gpL-like
MAGLVPLTDAEITAVAGGATTQTVSVAVNQQSTATVTTSASATNAGNVTATIAGSLIRAAIMRGSRAHLVAVQQIRVFTALNTIHFG